ncbi:hypothetical protein GXW83_16330 [Streptacidiphilus sp. PB12-B1b]|uniref:hypothetical protein n=1 Tax=Streptacidiphilus sp. PB12-B1b TaxID=2705012 RepID=UPI0015F8B206|nr:hypothetical protein [Streptacidiphilus sp. PB12-B1b]QMU77039.1 hypothetical protein GXW83_16330 [Streptacidiphilus sp. PB12-B1b]
MGVTMSDRQEAGEVLRYRRCRWCRSATVHSSFLCPVCGESELDEQVSAGYGVVSRLGATRGSCQLVHQPPHACVVTLDEGFTIPALLSEDRPTVVPLGARVCLRGLGAGPQAVEFRLA